MRRRAVDRLQRTLFFLLALALAAAPTVGLQHRIEHASVRGWIDRAVAGAAASDTLHADEHSEGNAHDCAALDAVATGDAPPPASFFPSVASHATSRVGAPRASFSPPARERPFDARAPPVSRA